MSSATSLNLGQSQNGLLGNGLMGYNYGTRGKTLEKEKKKKCLVNKPYSCSSEVRILCRDFAKHVPVKDATATIRTNPYFDRY